MKNWGKLLLVLSFVLFFSSCGKQEQAAAPETTQVPEKKVVVTCAGDCTLGTDVNFGGNTLPVVAKQQENDYGYFFRNVAPIFSQDDLTMVNLEGTLSTRGEREEKTFAFRGKPEYVNILKEGSVEAVTLANNHSMDYGEESFSDTKEALRDAGIDYVYKEDVLVKEINGVKVGVIGLYDLDGSAEKTLETAMTKMKEAGAQVVIAQIHWGIEGENTPESSQRALAKKIVDAGADLVIGHHPHVLQGIERYKGKYIVYSLGNFCFGGNQNPKDKDTLIFQQTFRLDENDELCMDDDYKLIPCSISSVGNANNYQPTPLGGEDAERVIEKVKRFSRNFTESALKFSLWQEDGLKIVDDATDLNNGERPAKEADAETLENEEETSAEKENRTEEKTVDGEKHKNTPEHRDVIIL